MNKKLKTYAHLSRENRMPSDYEVVSSQLHYHTHQGLEVRIPFAQWYEMHHGPAGFQCPDWEAFLDPRQTTYASYMKTQSGTQHYLEGLFETWEKDEEPCREGVVLSVWQELVSPLLYPFHGLQMVAAYLGQMAPSGKITIACAFQAADEIRRTQHLARRLGQLCKTCPDLVINRQRDWQELEHWQGFRKLLEELLVTYNWSEALVALGFVVKPHFDHLILRELPQLLAALGDATLKPLFENFYADCLWHQQWTVELLRVLCEAVPENHGVLAGIAARWNPRVKTVICEMSALYQKILRENVEIQRISFGEDTITAVEQMQAHLLGVEPAQSLTSS